MKFSLQIRAEICVTIQTFSKFTSCFTTCKSTHLHPNSFKQTSQTNFKSLTFKMINSNVATSPVVHDRAHYDLWPITAIAVGILGIVISIIYWNSACERDLQSLLLATGIVLLVCGFYLTYYFLNFSRAAANSRTTLLVKRVILLLLIMVSFILSLVLTVYTFKISTSNHICNDILYGICAFVGIAGMILDLIFVTYFVGFRY